MTAPNPLRWAGLTVLLGWLWLARKALEVEGQDDLGLEVGAVMVAVRGMR